MPCRLHSLRAPIATVFMIATTFAAADEFEQPPIEYSKSMPDNIVSQLQSRIDRSETELAFEDKCGYLQSLLTALHVPLESQMLVFSKTSLQQRRISPRTPRAIFFNDDVYVGYCASGDVLEVSAVDPKLGAVFYTLDQQPQASPRFERQTDNCLLCHANSRTQGVPGHVVRSLFVNQLGEPLLSEGSKSVDHTTALADRWGGWYVTGKHGRQTHLGNLIVHGRNVPRPVENSQGLNVTQLADRVQLDRYPSQYSDIVALMVFEHQTLVHNCITKANFATRQALDYQQMMNSTMEQPPNTPLESTTRRIQGAGDDLVDALLLVDEAKLAEPVSGVSGYAEAFARTGISDSQGRSLRQFDLQTRIFKYPCSYLIYSQAFDQLPKELLDYVWRRMWEVLAEDSDAKHFAHLSKEDKQAILEILRETKQTLPDYWRAVVKGS